MVSRSVAIATFALVLAASPASGQRVLLQIKPHVGDTIKMHLTQMIEMSGSQPNASPDSANTMTTSTEVFSRAIPFQWTSGGTLIHAITDSVTSSPRGSAGAELDLRRKATPPSPAVLRVATDGAIEVVDDGDANSELRHLFAEMPSMLPGRTVSVGGRWTKEMRIPLTGDPGAEGTVKAILHFDSLSRSGEMAFISIRGTIARFVNADRRAPASRYHTSGTFTGSMQIDRALGWITDARSVVSVLSEIADGRPSSLQHSAKPLQIHTKVSVWARAMKQR